MDPGNVELPTLHDILTIKAEKHEHDEEAESYHCYE
jgi:hypothetical protein